MHIDAAQRLAIRALANGAARKSLARVSWDIHDNCTDPVYRELSVRPDLRDAKSQVIRPGKTQSTIIVELTARCRKCQACRDKRRALWSARAAAETAMAQRTWFGTLTLRPEAHFAAEVRTSRRLRAGSVQFEKLDSVEQFRERHAEIGRDLTLWVKRVRKNTDAKIRVLIVAEAHKSGLPHYHCLVHECAGTVTHRDLTQAWALGFTNFKLITDARAVFYVTKYLAKSALARVRASSRYGQGHMGLAGVGSVDPTRTTTSVVAPITKVSDSRRVRMTAGEPAPALLSRPAR